MCKITEQQVVEDGAAVGQALDNLGDAVQPEDPSLASSLITSGNAIIAATANWKEGDALSIITDVENAAIIVLNTIPVTSPFANLVAIAFAALNLLITNAQTQGEQTGNTIADAHLLLKTASETENPWQGKAQIKHHFPNSPRKDFQTAWNEEAAKVGVGLITL